MSAYKLESVGMVGALRDSEGALDLLDSSLHRYVHDVLDRMELPVKPGDPDVINLTDPIQPRDFLKDQMKTDVLVLCNVAHLENFEAYESRIGLFARMARNGMYSIREADLHGKLLLSEDHWQAGVWAKKIAESGAKVVFVFGDDTMPLDDLVPPGYSAVVVPTGPSLKAKMLWSNDFLRAIQEQGKKYPPLLEKVLMDSGQYVLYWPDEPDPDFGVS